VRGAGGFIMGDVNLRFRGGLLADIYFTLGGMRLVFYGSLCDGGYWFPGVQARMFMSANTNIINTLENPWT